MGNQNEVDTNGQNVAEQIRFIDLFAGLGGFRIALEAEGGKCVFSSEIEKNARYVYEANFFESPSGDITEIDAASIPDHHVLCAGFPCQPFSVCGKQHGFNETRGTLFFEIERIIRAKRPAVIFLENVANLLKHDNSRTFAVILKTLENCGYTVFYEVLNASFYGIPTSRKRVYIVAFRVDMGVKEFAFPAPTYEPVKLADVLIPDCPPDRWEQQTRLPVNILKIISPSAACSLKPIAVGHIGMCHPARQGYRVYSDQGHAITFCAHGGGLGAKTGLYYDNGRVRRLAPRECLRVMGFPDSFMIPATITADQTRSLTGNTVVPPLIRRIYVRILAALSEAGFDASTTVI